MSFDQFWSQYPRRVAKKDALRAWGKLTPEQQQLAVDVLPRWGVVWSRTEIQYIPHPATWLNGWRFEDELPPAPKENARAAVMNDFVNPPNRFRSPSDEHASPALRIVSK